MNQHKTGALNSRLRLPTLTALTLAIASANAVLAQAPSAAGSAVQPWEVVVTARNRAEVAQNVPIPITVVGGDRIARDRAFTVADLTQRAPGLTATTPNARRTGVSVRGIGKTSGNDNMEAAVGTIIDDVFYTHVGMTYQDFTDLERVELLRGPQGTLLGKNTSMGAVKYTTRAPSFDTESSVDVETGVSHDSFKLRASRSDGLIDDTLAYRASFFVDKQEGDLRNVNPAVGGHWHERNRYGGRVKLLWLPTDALSVTLNVDAANTRENSNTKPFMVDPATLSDGSAIGTSYSSRLARAYFGGYQPIIGSWTTLDMDQAEPLITKNHGFSVVATLDLGSAEATSITAARWLHFDAKNDSEQTRFAIARSGTLLDTRQLSQEFRLNGTLGDAIEYQSGIYLLNNEVDTTGRNVYGKDAGAFYATNAQYNNLRNDVPALQAALDQLIVTTNQRPVTDSVAVFGQIDWHVSDRFTLTTGLRQTWEEKTNDYTRLTGRLDGAPVVSTGNSVADAIRSATTGRNVATVVGQDIDDSAVSWLINPSFSLTDDILLYASIADGQKSGAVAFANNGDFRNVEPEHTRNYEIGVKSALLDRRVQVNANLYYTTVQDYQNVTSEVDANSATGYSSRLGNIPELEAQGIELDANILVSDGFSLNLGLAYNDAAYADWRTATCPRSVPTSIAVCDNTGRQIVGAPLWTGIVGFDYEVQLGSSYRAKIFGNHIYRSEHNLEQLLSPYGYQGDYTLTDLGLGLTRQTASGNDWELSLVGKNVFDTKYTTSVNDFSNSAPVGYDGIGAQRYVGLLFRTTF